MYDCTFVLKFRSNILLCMGLILDKEMIQYIFGQLIALVMKQVCSSAQEVYIILFPVSMEFIVKVIGGRIYGLHTEQSHGVSIHLVRMSVLL